MPVVKFPGVEKTIHEMTPEEIEEQFNRVVPTLPVFTDGERVAYQQKLDEEFYDEDARYAITDFSVLLSNYRDATIGKYGENSAEASAVVEQIAPIKARLRQFRDNIYDPNVKDAVKSLKTIWEEYKGGYYDEKGELQRRNKPVGPEVVSAFWGTANFDI